MKPRGTREYVRHNKEYVLLNRYLKLISKKSKKQKGAGELNPEELNTILNGLSARLSKKNKNKQDKK